MLNARKVDMFATPNVDNVVYHLSQSVGSGKTKAVENKIKLGDEYNLFVSPTKRLAEEIADRLKSESTIEPVVVHTERSEYADRPIKDCILEEVGKLSSGGVRTIIVTTEGFRRAVLDIGEIVRGHYNLYLDEGIKALSRTQVKDQRLPDYLELLDIAADGAVRIRKGYEKTISDIVNSPKVIENLYGARFLTPSFVELAKMLNSGLFDVYAKVTEKSISAVGLIKPSILDGFRSATIITAMFEQTLLAKAWKNKYGVVLKDYETDHEMFDTHKEAGKRMRIWHVLHPDDHAANETLKRHFETGAANANPKQRERVIDRIAETVEHYFGGIGSDAYCWSANNYFRNFGFAMTGTRMPFECDGLDEFKAFDTVVSLGCNNPEPWVKTIASESFGIDAEEFYPMLRLAHTYQTIGRCSLRDRLSDRPVNVVVLSKRCAEDICSIFEGCEFKGQLGNLPSYRLMKKTIAYSPRDHRAYSKYRSRRIAKGQSFLPKEDWYHEERLPRLV